MQFRHLLVHAREDNPTLALAAVKSGILFMFATMAVYGTFIPNTWRRAALVVAPMALAPLVVSLILHLLHPELIEFTVRVASFEQVSEHVAHAADRRRRLGLRDARRQHPPGRGVRGPPARPVPAPRAARGGGDGRGLPRRAPAPEAALHLKLIRPGRAADPRALARFEREVRTTAQLSHPNTVEVYDYGRTEDGTFYYVMEYLPGLSLAELVDRHGPLPAGRVIYLLRQACQALQEAHASGLIHRDLKPANIFAALRGGRYDVTKLLDFGLVKPIAEAPSLQVSREGAITGSPLYMSPEQASGGRSPDPRSDIYSLGAVAYFLLTGRAPFHGESALEVMIAHARDTVTPPSQVRTGVPFDLEHIVLRCLAKDPANRYQDAEALEAALASCESANDWDPHRPPIGGGRRTSCPRVRSPWSPP